MFFFLTLQQTEKIENFIKTGVPSKSLYLVYAEANQTESNGVCDSWERSSLRMYASS